MDYGTMNHGLILLILLTLSIPNTLSSLSHESIAGYKWVELVNPDLVEGDGEIYGPPILHDGSTSLHSSISKLQYRTI